MSTKAAGNRGNRGTSPIEKAREQQREMAGRIDEIVERARKAGTARPPGKVKTRRVDPKTLRKK